MRKLVIAVLVTAVSAVAAAQAFGVTRKVKVGDDYFLERGDPPTITVKKGTRVRWNWKGDERHNVSVAEGPRRFSSDLKRDGSFSRKLKKTGTYEIVCTIHQPDMSMTIRVVR